MPKIILPEKAKCWKCGVGLYKCEAADGLTLPCWKRINLCDCEDGYRWDLGDLYRAVENVGGYLSTVLLPREGEPDYVGTIDFCGEAFEARGDSYELAAVAVINKANEEAE